VNDFLLQLSHVLITLLILPFFIFVSIALAPLAYLKAVAVKVKLLRQKITKKSKTKRAVSLAVYLVVGLAIQLLNSVVDVYHLYVNLYQKEETLILREENK